MDLSTYSWIWKRFGFQENDVRQSSDKIDVLKSRDTQVHIQERALHEWLISRGLSLSPQQALSIKNVYQQGFSVTALHVRPRHKSNVALANETWTSTWIFSHEVDEPYYLSLWPSESNLLNFDFFHSPRQNKHIASPSRNDSKSVIEKESLQNADKSLLKLTFISDQTLRPEHQDISETMEERIRGTTKTLSRIQLKALNQSLNAQNWSFNRRGVLSHFILDPPLGLQRIRAVVADEKQIIEPKPQIKVQKYKLALPLEFLISFLIALSLILKKKM